ncbi:alpha/beta fold hydrolase [Glutamicibacter sp. NPDC087344]|uniref:alpha/beta fold hydrolase n=1 Tax=Glutamicibacter sp. NPDC087344 TaxID=3363994 RepID=UPI00380CAD67
MPTIHVDGQDLYYEEFGHGEEVIISSANGFHPTYPASLAQAPTNYRVITLQTRGFGRSSRLETAPPQGYLNRWAEDVIALADHLNIPQFTYTGISHGGGIGWVIAHRFGHRLKALLSVVGTPHLRYGVTDSSEGRRKIVDNPGNVEVIREAMLEIAGPTPPGRETLREQVLEQALATKLERDPLEQKINQGMPFPEATDNDSLREVLGTITVPVLILGGMRDGVIPSGSSVLAGTAVPGAKTVLFEDEGHWIAKESPERLIREIKLFMDELAGTALPLRNEAMSLAQGEAGTV